MRTFWKRLLLFSFLIFLLCAPSCENAGEAPATEPHPSQSAAESEPSKGVDLIFPCSSRDLLSTYENSAAEDFHRACREYESRGFSLYSEFDVGGNLAKTYTKGDAMAHLYYHPATEELNVVLSQTASSSLPPATAESEGKYPCTVTQLHQAKIGGGAMGYVIRLTDGSFLIYDGGMESSCDEILEILREQSDGETPVVRAWLLTHLHNDHYTAFHEMARRARTEPPFILEHVIASPLVEGYRNFLTAVSADILSFPNVRFIFAHTGMKLNFPGLTMEILYTPESLYKKGDAVENFNNTSVLTRLTNKDGSMLITGDLAKEAALLAESYYGAALRSDMVQMSHHGLEDCPLSFYEKVSPSVLWYPCGTATYRSDRNKEVRDAVEALPDVKEILIAGEKRHTRSWPTK